MGNEIDIELYSKEIEDNRRENYYKLKKIKKISKKNSKNKHKRERRIKGLEREIEELKIRTENGVLSCDNCTSRYGVNIQSSRYIGEDEKGLLFRCEFCGYEKYL